MRTNKGIPQDVVFVRHTQSSAPIDGDDLGRTPSPAGIELAQNRTASFKGINVFLGLTSVASRARQTGEIVFPRLPFIEIPELYLPIDEKDRADGDKAFADYGYASLRTYIAKDTTGWLLRHGMSAVSAIRKAVSKGPQSAGISADPHPSSMYYEGKSLDYVAIAGHAVFLNLIAMLMFPQHAEEIQDICLGEAEALVMGPDYLQHISGDAKFAL